MGDGNRKTKRLLQEQPTCTYCGGIEASASRDHCPPTAVFDNRWRPEGMEFGACRDCHEGTREMDAVVAFVSRIRGTEPGAEKEIRRHINAVLHRYPHLLEHIEMSEHAIEYNGAPGHPVHIGPDSGLHRVMDAFGARMGLAMYRLVLGQPAPSGARIAARWDTNAGLDSDETLNEFLKALGGARTLVQGSKHVADQFRYWTATVPDEPKLFGCVAVFREAFGVISFVDARDGEPAFPAMYEPGFLKGFKV